MFSSFEILAGQETIGCHLLKKVLDCFPWPPLYFIAQVYTLQPGSEFMSRLHYLWIVGSLTNQLTAAFGIRIDSSACICVCCIFWVCVCVCKCEVVCEGQNVTVGVILRDTMHLCEFLPDLKLPISLDWSVSTRHLPISGFQALGSQVHTKVSRRFKSGDFQILVLVMLTFTRSYLSPSHNNFRCASHT